MHNTSKLTGIDCGKTTNQDNAVCVQGVVHQLKASMLLGCLEVMIENVVDVAAGQLNITD